MLNHETRSAILMLAAKGHGTRFIAKAVGVSRKSVQKVRDQNTAAVPEIERAGQLDPFLLQVRELHVTCAGNLVRVHEELRARYQVEVPYSTLTRFCRDAEIGVARKQAAGRYEFGLGQEMQHDTSPHTVEIAGEPVALQCASLVMCFSRRRFIQCYRRWNRFQARIFLTRALEFLGGSSASCMLDNSTVIMIGGTGPHAYPAPEMKAFADRFGFKFVSHHVGDANRSARVEGPFWHVEHNFYPGRTFTDLKDLNTQAIAWCRTYNATYHKAYQGIPDELGAIERSSLLPLPAWIPEPVEVHGRKVDDEACVILHTNSYSVPENLIECKVEVHETEDRVQVFNGLQLVAEHPKRPFGARARERLPEHRRPRRAHGPRPPSPEEVALRAAGPAVSVLCDTLRAQRGGQALQAMRKLRRIWLEYPTDIVEAVVARALEFGLVDLHRIEQMVLRNIRGDFFKLPKAEDDDGR